MYKKIPVSVFFVAEHSVSLQKKQAGNQKNVIDYDSAHPVYADAGDPALHHQEAWNQNLQNLFL